MKKMGHEFIGVIKTAHASSPKEYLENNLKDKCAGSQLVLFTEIDGEGLLAIGYKYNKRKVLFFVATPGSGATTEGEPYVQRWADEHGNLLTRHIPRPAIVSTYFGISPRVDNHNQSRQHDLAIEEKWDGMHTMEKLERTGASARQSRCRWCLHHEDKESWTTFYCVECDIPLCGPTNRAGRKCWNIHCRCDPEDLRELTAKCAKSCRTT